MSLHDQYVPLMAGVDALRRRAAEHQRIASSFAADARSTELSLDVRLRRQEWAENAYAVARRGVAHAAVLEHMAVAS